MILKMSKFHPIFYNQPNIIRIIKRMRECETCNLKKPPKASHCKYCNNCVKNFDQ